MAEKKLLRASTRTKDRDEWQINQPVGCVAWRLHNQLEIEVVVEMCG